MVKENGKVPLEIGGKEYTLHFTANAMCDMEDRFDTGLPALMAAMEDTATMRMGHVRALLWGGLREHHPDLSVRDVGDLIQEAGGFEAVMGQLEKAVTASMPDAADKSEGAGAEKPGRARKAKG